MSEIKQPLERVAKQVAALVSVGILDEDDLHDAEKIIGTTTRSRVEELLDDEEFVEDARNHVDNMP